MPHILILVGVVLGISVGFSVAGAFSPKDFPSEYWALLGGVFGSALAGAVAILIAKFRQDEAKNDRRRRQLGARAVLASDLSQIIDYAHESAATAKEGRALVKNDYRGSHIECPKIPQDVLIRLQKLTELLDGSVIGPH